MWLLLARKSLWHRKYSVLLTLIGLLISISLLFAIEHIRVQSKENFKRTVSGVDLIVAARSSQINVLLSSVFRMGANPNNVSWATYQEIREHPSVVWSIPLSLGDSYKGYPVVGTTSDYFDYYQYGNKQALAMQAGEVFSTPYDVVIGAALAKNENLQVGSQVVVSHGSGKVSFTQHAHHPFVVSGILKATGTPVDKSMHVPLIAIDEMHKPSAVTSVFSRKRAGENPPRAIDAKDVDQPHVDRHTEHVEHEGHEHEHDEHDMHEHTAQVTKTNTTQAKTSSVDLLGQPQNISAFLLKLNSPLAILTQQRDINKYDKEAISAIIPGLALAELWQVLGSVETVLQIISWLVLVASLIGLITMLLASMNERKSEILVLRAMGASPLFIASLIQLEALLISGLACIGAYMAVSSSILLMANNVLTEYGLFISANIASVTIFTYIGLILGLTVLVASLPTFMAYKGAKKLFE